MLEGAFRANIIIDTTGRIEKIKVLYLSSNVGQQIEKYDSLFVTAILSGFDGIKWNTLTDKNTRHAIEISLPIIFVDYTHISSPLRYPPVIVKSSVTIFVDYQQPIKEK